MLRVLGVSHGLEKILVAGYSSYVFGWTGTGTGQANRIPDTFLRRKATRQLWKLASWATGCSRSP